LPEDADAAQAARGDFLGDDDEIANLLGGATNGRARPVRETPFFDSIGGVPGKRPAGFAGEIAQRQVGVNENHVFAAGKDRSFFDVEFVADVADEFFEDVFEADDAEHLVFGVDDDGEVAAGFLEKLEHGRQARVGGEGEDGPEDVGEFHLVAEGVVLPEHFFDVRDADNFFEGGAANWKAAVAGGLGSFEIGRQGLVAPEDADFGFRQHDFFGGGFFEAKGFEHEPVDQFVGGMDVPGMGEDVLEFVGCEGVFAFAGGLDAGKAEHPVGGAVEHPDDRPEQVVEHDQSRRGPEGHGAGALDGEGFRREFAHDDVEKRDDEKRGDVRDGFDGVLVANADGVQWRVKPPGEERFSEPAESEAGEGDAELRRREIGVEVFGDVDGQADAPVAGLEHRPQLRGADFDDGKLSGNKEPVGQHEQQNYEDLPAKLKNVHSRRLYAPCSTASTNGGRGYFVGAATGLVSTVGIGLEDGAECGETGAASTFGRRISILAFARNPST